VLRYADLLRDPFTERLTDGLLERLGDLVLGLARGRLDRLLAGRLRDFALHRIGLYRGGRGGDDGRCRSVRTLLAPAPDQHDTVDRLADLLELVSRVLHLGPGGELELGHQQDGIGEPGQRLGVRARTGGSDRDDDVVVSVAQRPQQPTAAKTEQSRRGAGARHTGGDDRQRGIFPYYGRFGGGRVDHREQFGQRAGVRGTHHLAEGVVVVIGGDEQHPLTAAVQGERQVHRYRCRRSRLGRTGDENSDRCAALLLRQGVRDPPERFEGGGARSGRHQPVQCSGLADHRQREQLLDLVGAADPAVRAHPEGSYGQTEEKPEAQAGDQDRPGGGARTAARQFRVVQHAARCHDRRGQLAHQLVEALQLLGEQITLGRVVGALGRAVGQLGQRLHDSPQAAQGQGLLILDRRHLGVEAGLCRGRPAAQVRLRERVRTLLGLGRGDRREGDRQHLRVRRYCDRHGRGQVTRLAGALHQLPRLGGHLGGPDQPCLGVQVDLGIRPPVGQVGGVLHTCGRDEHTRHRRVLPLLELQIPERAQ
jgi:hypothetical protein